jgi:hypothetical protein
MPPTRISYRQLPLPVRTAIEATIGAPTSAASVNEGLNSPVAALLRTPAGHFFVKALPADHRWVWTQRREAEIAAHVRPVAAGMIARIEAGGWDVVVFEALDGHHADYRPESPDLPKVVDLITRIGVLPAPDIKLREATQRLAAYVKPGDDLQHFAGDALLHTDWNSANVIIDEHARIVDWGWATRGAPWLDAGYWSLWLIASGHDPCSAERWAAQVPAWHTAPKSAVAAFAAATARMWTDIGGDEPDPWTQRMISASNRWHSHRR